MEVHKHGIVLLTYNPSGSRMVTCDANGLVCVWRGLTCLSKYQRSGLINHCCFAELSLDSSQKLGNLFFFGGSLGVVTLADDSNHLSEICKVGGSIAALQFYSVRPLNYLIAETEQRDHHKQLAAAGAVPHLDDGQALGAREESEAVDRRRPGTADLDLDRRLFALHLFLREHGAAVAPRRRRELRAHAVRLQLLQRQDQQHQVREQGYVRNFA